MAHRIVSPRLGVGLVLVMAIVACQSATAGSGTPMPGASASPAVGGAPATLIATGAPTGTTAPGAASTSAPAPSGLPPQTSAATLRQPERRSELERLSNLLTFKVVGANNAALGSVADFIVNTCETFIVYIVIDPDPALKAAAGQQLIVPFEAVTINSGTLDAQAKTIGIQVAASQAAAAPASAKAVPLLPTSWEQPVRAYWRQVVRLGKLSAVCGAGGGSTYKIAYASALLKAPLKDGNGNPLGTVTEAILTPESGQVEFYVVSLANNQGLVLVPLGKTNIPDEALKPGAATELVLLAQPAQLAGAPRLANANAATDDGAQGAARQYWGH